MKKILLALLVSAVIYILITLGIAVLFPIILLSELNAKLLMGGNIVLTTILTYFIFLKPFKNVYIKLYGAFFSTVIVANIFKLISISFDGEFSIAYTLLILCFIAYVLIEAQDE